MISHDSMPQNVDLQQMILALDPQKALQNIYMSQQNMPNGSPSPSSQPSSGAASTVGNNNGEFQNVIETPSKAPTPAAADLGNMQHLFAGLMPQLAPQNMPPNMANLLEQMAAGGMPMFNPLAALQGNGFLNMNGSPNKGKPKEMKVSTPQQQQALNFGFPFSLAPSTSTASQQSVIVSQAGDGDVTPPQKRMKVESNEDDDRIKPFDSMLMASLAAGNSSCDECGKDCGNPLALITHKAQEHNEEKRSPVSYKCNECDKEFSSSQFLEQHKNIHHNAVAQRLLAMGMPPGFPQLNFMLPNLPQQFMPDFDPAAAMAQLSTPKGPAHIKRQYSSNGKNYCDLCNKEVCNKYFLRTHMLKMHGIVIDENKTVIGNIDTTEKERQGTLSFRCDICHIELKNRQLLRQHKQESHGVMPMAPQRISGKTSIVGPPSMVNPALLAGADGESKCPMCERRVPSNQLSLHIQTDHVGDLPSNLMAPQTPTSPPSHECKLCPFAAGDDSMLQMHMISNHTSEYLQMQLKEERKVDPNILRCGQCQYTTRDQKNMEMHSERHERLNEAMQQRGQEEDEDETMHVAAEVALKMAAANQMSEMGGPFKCGVCSASYQDEASLDAHATVAHNGLNLTVPKKEAAEVEKAIERNSHTSGSLSPSTESLPEGLVKSSGDKNHMMQSFVLRINDPQGIFLGEMVAQLPVKSLALGPAKIVVEAIPQ